MTITQIQNLNNVKLSPRNTSGVENVYWYKRLNKWRAQIRIYGYNRHLGLFEDLADAEVAVRAAREEYHRELDKHGDPRDERSKKHSTTYKN